MKFPRTRNWTLAVNANMIDVTVGSPSYNEQWKFTDAAGHEHSYKAGLKTTLVEVVDEEHLCDGTEGYEDHDPHMQVDESHWECRVCREVIQPKMDPPFTPKEIVGSWNAKLTGIRRSGLEVVIALTGDELAELRGAATDDDRAAIAERIIEESQQIISTSYTR